MYDGNCYYQKAFIKVFVIIYLTCLLTALCYSFLYLPKECLKQSFFIHLAKVLECLSYGSEQYHDPFSHMGDCLLKNYLQK